MKSIGLVLVPIATLFAFPSPAMEEAKTNFHEKAAQLKKKNEQIENQLKMDLANVTTTNQGIKEINKARIMMHFSKKGT